MKPAYLKRIRQSQRDKRIHDLRRRPRLLMPVERFVDTSRPHTLKMVNCEWYQGIQNLIVPKGSPERTRNIVRIDVVVPEEPAYLLMQGFRSYAPHLPVGYRVEWDGRMWLNPAWLSVALYGDDIWAPIDWNKFDWVVQ